jgi:hypothetical protein
MDTAEIAIEKSLEMLKENYSNYFFKYAERHLENYRIYLGS